MRSLNLTALMLSLAALGSPTVAPAPSKPKRPRTFTNERIAAAQAKRERRAAKRAKQGATK